MLRKFAKIAFQNLLSQPAFTLVNVSGLAIGLACTIFMGIYVYHHINFDRYHKNSDRIYRIVIKGEMAGDELNLALTSIPMASVLKKEYPQIEDVLRINRSGEWLVKYHPKIFNESSILFGDSTFFNFFDIPLVTGNPDKALTKPKSFVISQKIAKRYFDGEDPVGKYVKVENDSALYEITGVFDKVPENTHFTFDFLGSLNSLKISRSKYWISHSVYTYILVKEGSDIKKLETGINQLVKKYVNPQVKELLNISEDSHSGSKDKYYFQLQPLESIHLHSNLRAELEPGADLSSLYLFCAIALFILIIACVNFINLNTIISSKRLKEIGIKKIAGSEKTGLVKQFLMESILLSIIALLVALIMVETLFPQFNKLTWAMIDIYTFFRWKIFLMLFLMAIVVGILAGVYPAFYLSSFQPVKALKGGVTQKYSRLYLRKILVVVQFTVSIIVALSTLLIYKQQNYMISKDPGFHTENMLVIRRSDALQTQIESFKEIIQQNPHVIHATNSIEIPGISFLSNGFLLEGDISRKTYLLNENMVTDEFSSTYGLKIKEGRFFSRVNPSDSSAIIINEATVRYLDLENPLKTRLYLPGKHGNMEYLHIIGVIKDFHYQSLHNQIQPMIFSMLPKNLEGYITIKLDGINTPETLTFIRKTWEKFTPDHPFEYFWFSDHLKKLYNNEIRAGKIMVILCCLSLFISSLGLLGLIAFTTNQRKKEIGVRKVMGAGPFKIIRLLNAEIIFLLLLASAIVLPYYFVVRYWFNSFAYHMNFNLVVFLFLLMITVIGIMLLTQLTVGFCALHAAKRNPAETLHNE